MKAKSIKITTIWKFLYWPVVWILIFIPGLIWPVALEGVWLTLSRIVGMILLLFALFYSNSGGRVLARLGHREEHKTFWPDRFMEFGCFACMRHPMHMGLALFPIALALLFGRVLPIVGSGWGKIQQRFLRSGNKGALTLTDFVQSVSVM